MSTAPLPANPDSGSGPQHVAIIMDGNGRWAKSRGLPRVAGHRRGADAVRRVVRGAGELGIPVLTLFAFSTENWTRPADEVADLMGLLRHYLRSELEELRKNGARLRVIGAMTMRFFKRRLPIWPGCCNNISHPLASPEICATLSLPRKSEVCYRSSARMLTTDYL